MKILDFKVFLEPEASGSYAAVSPSRAGCYSQGETTHEALANIREAFELALEDMQVHGEPAPDPSGVLIGSIVVTRRIPSSRLSLAMT